MDKSRSAKGKQRWVPPPESLSSYDSPGPSNYQATSPVVAADEPSSPLLRSDDTDSESEMDESDDMGKDSDMSDGDMSEDSEDSEDSDELGAIVQSTLETYKFCMDTVYAEVRQSLQQALNAMQQSATAMSNLSQTASMSTAAFFQVSQTAHQSLHELMVERLALPASPPQDNASQNIDTTVYDTTDPVAGSSHSRKVSNEYSGNRGATDGRGHTSATKRSVPSLLSRRHCSKRGKLEQEAKEFISLIQIAFDAGDPRSGHFKRERERLQNILKRLAETPMELLPPTSLEALGLELEALEKDVKKTQFREPVTPAAENPEIPGIFHRFVFYPFSALNWSRAWAALFNS
ncbi:hypothetical protein DFQ26_003216 [Actinomortierella ambigua]|nr:hypothetical protein DFQ26_003216 [Actinomortierella ambigua]